MVPGDHVPGIPNFRFKLGGEYQITNPWKFGADLNVIGSQWLVGDQSNQNPKLPAYWVVNMHSSYKISENVEVFGLVRNLFNQHYALSGTFFDVTNFPYLNLTDPRTFVPGMPFAAYLGVRGTLPSGGAAFADASPPVLTKTPSEFWRTCQARYRCGQFINVDRVHNKPVNTVFNEPCRTHRRCHDR